MSVEPVLILRLVQTLCAFIAMALDAFGMISLLSTYMTADPFSRRLAW